MSQGGRGLATPAYPGVAAKERSDGRSDGRLAERFENGRMMFSLSASHKLSRLHTVVHATLSLLLTSQLNYSFNICRGL